MWITKTPLRISLAGGGTDLPQFYERYGHGAVCSMAINKYVYCIVKELPQEFPFAYKLNYSTTELANSLDGISHPILKQAIKDAGFNRLDFTSMSDIPAGTGMGSSSSFTVGALHALERLRGQYPGKDSLAQSACDLEINKLKEPIGKQDQYAAAYGGLNYYRFEADGSVLVAPIILDLQRETSFLDTLRLFYIGKQSRSASEILKDQKKEGEDLVQLRLLAEHCMSALTLGTPEDLGNLLNEAWIRKKKLSSKISTPEIDSLYEAAKYHGAWGGKLLGAGGSGFLLISAPKDVTIDLGLKQIPFKIDYSGSVSYYL